MSSADEAAAAARAVGHQPAAAVIAASTGTRCAGCCPAAHRPGSPPDGLADDGSARRWRWRTQAIPGIGLRVKLHGRGGVPNGSITAGSWSSGGTLRSRVSQASYHAESSPRRARTPGRPTATSMAQIRWAG